MGRSWGRSSPAGNQQVVKAPMTGPDAPLNRDRER